MSAVRFIKNVFFLGEGIEGKSRRVGARPIFGDPWHARFQEIGLGSRSGSRPGHHTRGILVF